jgi:hypothetical protein
MRRVTRQEGESWRALAQRHGFGSAEGRFVLGRFIVEDRDENGLPPAEGDYSPETVTTVPPTLYRSRG